MEPPDPGSQVRHIKDNFEHAPINLGGFGLGALNDADEDDLDVYEQVQAQPLRHGVAYDQIDIDGNDTTVIGSTKESKSRAVCLNQTIIFCP